MTIFSAFNLGILLILVCLPRLLFRYGGESKNKIPYAIRTIFGAMVGGLWLLQFSRGFRITLPVPAFVQDYVQTYFSILPTETQFQIQMEPVLTAVLTLQLFLSSYIKDCCGSEPNPNKFLHKVHIYRWVFLTLLIASVSLAYVSMVNVSNTFLNAAHLMSIGMAINIVVMEALAYHVQWKNVGNPDSVYHSPSKAFVTIGSAFVLMIALHLPHEPENLRAARHHVIAGDYQTALERYQSILDSHQPEPASPKPSPLHPIRLKAELGKAKALEQISALGMARFIKQLEDSLNSGKPLAYQSSDPPAWFDTLNQARGIYQPLMERDKWCSQAVKGFNYANSIMNEYPVLLTAGARE